MKIQILFSLVVIGTVVSAGAAVDVPLTVVEPSQVVRRAWPVTSGVPLAPGALRDPAAVALKDDVGQHRPVQAEALVRWPDGSVRWLLVDFQADLAAGSRGRYRLVSAPPLAVPATGPVLRVISTSTGATLETGPLKVELTRDGFDPFGAVWLDRDGDGRFAANERVTRPGGGIFVRDTKGGRYEAARAPAEIVVEEAGPLRAVVRVSGSHGGAEGSFFRYVLRLHAFRGQPYLKCSYTFINDRPGEVMTSLEELGVDLRLADEAGPAGAAQLGGQTPGEGRLFQVDERSFTVDGRGRDGRAPGWALVAGRHAGFAAGVREFWQQWPKSVEARGGVVTLGLCPDFPAGSYDGHPLEEESRLYYALRRGVHTFKVGVAKTHEIWVNFFATPVTADGPGRFFAAAEEPLLATVDPVHASATGAAGEFPPADPRRFSGYDAWLERALAGHLRRREQAREYGLLNYGDWYGERQVNWGNLEYDLQRGMLVQYLRTGDRRYFERGAQAARHHIDVDVVHAVNPLLKNPFGLPPKVGEIWLHSLNHTGGYYANAPLPVERTYQMGHSANYGHVWISGDLDYYYLTGDRRAREVALQVADMMTSAMTAKVGTHIRTLGWPTILVLSAYEATGDRKYLEAAARNWQALKQGLDPQRGWVVKLAGDHCLHPAGSTQKERDTKYRDQRCEGNVPFMEGLTLCALARYHRHSGDPEVLRAITIGIDQMIRECWQEDVKTFRYTACPLSTKTPYGLFMLSAEAMAYEARLTGNAEHRRILREGFQSAVAHGGGDGFGKGVGQMTFFAPHALGMLE
ncbi:MAG: glycoside hydrolase family 127 protein [Verrucomicrobia bacterium]|nr:glycoside hydrolase family 127 protein [Verrucomicrobiota bacterium]